MRRWKKDGLHSRLGWIHNRLHGTFLPVDHLKFQNSNREVGGQPSVPFCGWLLLLRAME